MPRLPSSGSGISGVHFSLIPVIATALWFPGLAGQAQNAPTLEPRSLPCCSRVWAATLTASVRKTPTHRNSLTRG